MNFQKFLRTPFVREHLQWLLLEKCESYEKVQGTDWNEYQNTLTFRVNKMFQDIIEIIPSKRSKEHS